MIQRGDKFIMKGMILEVKSARIDDHYIYVTFYETGYRKIPLKYFLKRFISITSLVNVDYFIRKSLYKMNKLTYLTHKVTNQSINKSWQQEPQQLNM